MKAKIETAEVNWRTAEREFRLHDIIGSECAKRGLEVALAGGHCVAFMATTGSPAASLLTVAARIADENRWPFKGYVVPVCPCGNFGTPKLECACDFGTLRDHSRTMRENTRDAVMFIETFAPRIRETGKGNEDERVMVARVMQCKMSAIRQPALANDGEELLRRAATELGGFLDRAKVLAVACTIAKMDYSPDICARHVSEAIQYVRSPFGDFDGYGVITTNTTKKENEE